MIESSELQKIGLCTLFLDLEKAFDQVPRSKLWEIMTKRGFPPDFVKLLKTLRTHTRGKVRNEGEVGDWFNITKGVRQGSKEGPILFNLFMDTIIRLALDTLPFETGVNILFRLDGQWYNTDQADRETYIRCLLFADDIVILARSEQELSTIYKAIEQVLNANNMSISYAKTKAMTFCASIAAPGLYPTPRVYPANSVAPFAETQTFKYLGQRKQAKGNVDAEISARINSASYTFNKLRRRVFCFTTLPLALRVRLFKAIMIPKLMYGIHILPLRGNDLQRLEKFQNDCLRRMFKVPVWRGVYIANNDIRCRAKVASVDF